MVVCNPRRQVQPPIPMAESSPPLPPPSPSPGQSVPRWLVVTMAQLVTALLVLGVTHLVIHTSLRWVNSLLRWVRWPVRLYGIAAFDKTYTGWIVVALLGLALASPWLLDKLLSLAYGQRPLSSRQLQQHYPVLLQHLRQTCRQQGWQLPQLRLISEAPPLCFSYGGWPGPPRIVVSQSLLDQFASAELRALYSYEMAHQANGDLLVISALGFGQLVTYTAYWRLAGWGDRLTGVAARSLGVGVNALYLVFWGLRQLSLWLSRLRSQAADSRALSFCDRPTDHQHALLHLTTALARDSQRQGHLHPLVVALEVLLPLSARAAVSPGSFLRPHNVDALLADDRYNPYRRWLLTQASHPPLGDRLAWFASQATARGQSPAWGITAAARAPWPPFSKSLLAQQKGPLLGLLIGGALALGLLLVGSVAESLSWYSLSSFNQNGKLLQGGAWLGLGLGMLIRINRLYPDFSSGLTSSSQVGKVLVNRHCCLPVEGQSLQMEGTLVGVPGLANGLGQQVYLASRGGLIKLGWTTIQLGWIQLFQPQQHPGQWLGQPVRIKAWGRRAGGCFWLDVAQLAPLNQPDHRLIDQGPWMQTLVSLGLALGGVLILGWG